MSAEQTVTPIKVENKIRESKVPTELVRFAINDLEAGQKERDAFTADEIALQALCHHPRYRKSTRQRSKAPRKFRMPFIASGLMHLAESKELGCRYEDDDGTVVYDKSDPAFSEDNRPKNLASYNRLYYLLKPEQVQAERDGIPFSIAAARKKLLEEVAATNGDGATPAGSPPQELIDDVAAMPRRIPGGQTL